MRIATQAIAAAGEVELMIRPERLRLGSAEGDGADNTFDMTVDDVINYGDSLLVIGKTHGLPLRARMVGGAADKLQAGAALKLAWSPADAHVLPRPPSRTRRSARDDEHSAMLMTGKDYLESIRDGRRGLCRRRTGRGRHDPSGVPQRGATPSP